MIDTPTQRQCKIVETLFDRYHGRRILIWNCIAYNYYYYYYYYYFYNNKTQFI